MYLPMPFYRMVDIGGYLFSIEKCGVLMTILIRVFIFFIFFMLTGCGDGSDCVNDNGPQAGQCTHYPDKTSCVQVSPYHHSCTLE